MSKPFFLYVHEHTSITVGVLTQMLGSWHHLVAYLSKQLDSYPRLATLPMGTGIYGPLVSEADKLTMGQELAVQVSHSGIDINGVQGIILANRRPHDQVSENAM